MKTINILSVISLCMLSLFACINEDPEHIQGKIIENKQAELEVETINKLLEDIKPSLQSWSSKLKEFDFITFEVVKNLHTNEISLENFKEVGIFPITDIDAYYKSDKAAYSVYCDNAGDDDDWEEECDGISSCGALIKKCFKEGGCAQICENKNTAEIQYASVELMFLPLKNKP